MPGRRREALGLCRREEVVQGPIVQNVRDGVPGLDHDESNGAGPQVATIGASSKGGDGGAGEWSQWAIEHPHDRADSDLIRRPGQRVAAAFALLGVDEACAPQLRQDLV